MNKEKELLAALVAMVEIINKRVPVLTAEEDRAVVKATELLTRLYTECSDCVDY